MRTKAKLWLKGLVGGVISGTASSGTAWLGLAGANAIDKSIPVVDWRGFLVILAISGVFNTLTFLKQSPLPPDDTDFIPKP